jgi:crossover junction endodeoxyribonuclease RuvC
MITGSGIIEFSNGKISLLNYDVIKQSSREAMTKRLKNIYDFILKKITIYKPNEFAIETAFYGKNIQSTMKLGQVRGAAIIAAMNKKLNIGEYSPREVKKSVTGSGAASKQQVFTIVKNILSVKINPKFFDASDAIAIALCHYFKIINGGSKFDFTKKKKTSWKEFVENHPEKIFT